MAVYLLCMSLMYHHLYSFLYSLLFNHCLPELRAEMILFEEPSYTVKTSEWNFKFKCHLPLKFIEGAHIRSEQVKFASHRQVSFRYH